MDTVTKYIPLIYLGAAAIVGFIMWRAASKAATVVSDTASAVNDARLRAGSAIGETVFNWFNPAASSPDVYIGVLFPDGLKHAISVRDIDASGYFRGPKTIYPWYDGKLYRIKSSGEIHKAELA